MIRDRRPAGRRSRTDLLFVCDVIDRYMAHAATYYVKHGKPRRTLACSGRLLAGLNDLYGDTPAGDRRRPTCGR